MNYTKKSDSELALDDLFDWTSENLGACTVSMIVSYIIQQTGVIYRTNQIQTALTSKGYSAERFYAGKEGTKKQGRFYKVPFVEGLTMPF